MSILCLAAEDDDGNTATGKVITSGYASTTKVNLPYIATATGPSPSIVTTESPAEKKKVSFAKKPLSTIVVLTGDDL